ncbi:MULTISPECIES: hypothetical protein [unclassified Streptomyces]|uniref:Uncharacterized protein n=1 Tax=Streptomyces sp. NBC_00060 TaxID=2975636 RepID=A0AAU2GQB9_9ACTN
MTISWGDAPTWVGAAFAGAAAVGAIWTLASQRQQIGEQRTFIDEQSQFMGEQRAFIQRQSEVLGLQERELVALAEERAKMQAQRVSMLAVMRAGPEELYPGIENSRCWEVSVQNNSDEVIRDVDVRCGPYLADAVWDMTPGRTEDGNPQRVTAPVAVIGPGRSSSFFLTPGVATHIANYPPVLAFTDANGQNWQFDHHGVRSRVDQPVWPV